jgi:hypothetical protein
VNKDENKDNFFNELKFPLWVLNYKFSEDNNEDEESLKLIENVNGRAVLNE